MLFLYRSNAELCAHMACTTKSAEIRQQWLELAKRWQDKANAEDPHSEPIDVVASAQLTPAQVFSRAPIEDQGGGKPEPASDPAMAPPLPNLASGPIAPDKEPQPDASDGGLNGEVLDDQWMQLIQEIRAK